MIMNFVLTRTMVVDDDDGITTIEFCSDLHDLKCEKENLFVHLTLMIVPLAASCPF